MEIYTGHASLGLIGRGRLRYVEEINTEIVRKQVEDTEAEKVRLKEALLQVSQDLQVLAAQATELVGASEAAIFEAQRMLLTDTIYTERIFQIIEKEGVDAIGAVSVVGEEIEKQFATISDPFFGERGEDVRAVNERLLACLERKDVLEKVTDVLSEPEILVAEHMSPGKLLQLAKGNIQGLVLHRAGMYSHVVILATGLGIPFLTGVFLPKDLQGKEAVLDGTGCRLIVEPTFEVVKTMETQDDAKQAANKVRMPLPVYANVGSLEEVKVAAELGAEGVGLLRSEIYYMTRDHLPTEEEETDFYVEVLHCMESREVIVRTLDLGRDKQLPYLPIPYPGLLHKQLRALYRAGTFGNLKIMYPMIRSVEQLEAYKQIELQVKQELRDEGIACQESLQVGIMIETPEAVAAAEELADLADFFSIGTNDLMQYTYGVDRESASPQASDQKKLMTDIRRVVSVAKTKGCPVGICGELAGERWAVAEFVGMQVDYISVSPARMNRIF